MTRKPLNTTYDVEAFQPADEGIVREQNVPSEKAALALAEQWGREALEVEVTRRDYHDHSDVRYTLIATFRPETA